MKWFSQSSHAICDLGLSIIKRLAPKEYEIQGSTTPVSLPAILYKKSEKKEGDDSAVSSIVLEILCFLFIYFIYLRLIHQEEWVCSIYLLLQIIKNLSIWQVKEMQAWLVDESSLAHFESLKLETTETVCSAA